MSNNTLISVRVVDDGNKQVLMPWNFVNIPHVSYNYSTLLSDIESGVYPSCKINSRCACGNIVLSHGTASSSFALKEEIRGEPMHDIVDKSRYLGCDSLHFSSNMMNFALLVMYQRVTEAMECHH